MTARARGRTMTVAGGATPGWTSRLRRDPLPALLAPDDPALTWNVRHDLLGEDLAPEPLWQLPAAVRLLRAQRADGSWPHPGGSRRLRSQEDYDQLGTYQALLPLVAKYRLDPRHPALPRAAEFLLGFQSAEGDLRGIYGRQYSPNYTAAIIALLVEAGYRTDLRVERAQQWLIATRQEDGGWAIPLRTRHWNFPAALALPEPLPPDRSRPSSHLVTGIVLRALVADAERRNSPETRRAAEWLATRLFLADAYPDRRHPSYWTKLAFPFRWTDLVSALDTLAGAGLTASEQHVAAGLQWLIDAQEADGLWSSGYLLARDREMRLWVSFAAARVFRRFFGANR